MKVKLNQPVYLQGKHYDEGETLSVSDRLGGAWVQTGKANEISSKKSVRTSKRKQTDETGGESGGVGVSSETDD